MKMYYSAFVLGVFLNGVADGKLSDWSLWSNGKNHEWEGASYLEEVDMEQIWNDYERRLSNISPHQRPHQRKLDGVKMDFNLAHLRNGSFVEHLGECTGSVCGMWGDPHIATCDGKDFECMGVGLFTLMENDIFNIQANFVEIGQEEYATTEFILEDGTRRNYALSGATSANDVVVAFPSDDNVPDFQFSFGDLNHFYDENGITVRPSEVNCTDGNIGKYWKANWGRQGLQKLDVKKSVAEGGAPTAHSCRKACEDYPGGACTKWVWHPGDHCWLWKAGVHKPTIHGDRSIAGCLKSSCKDKFGYNDCALTEPNFEDFADDKKESYQKHGQMGNCPLLFYVDGEMINLHGVGVFDGKKEGDKEEILYDGNGVVVKQLLNHKDDHWINIRYDNVMDGGEVSEIHIKQQGQGPGELWSCHWNVFVCIPEGLRESVSDSKGLMGSPDGVPANDFRTRDGEILDLNSTFADALDANPEMDERLVWDLMMQGYCLNNWCVPEEDSLLTLPSGWTWDDVECKMTNYTEPEVCLATDEEIIAKCSELSAELYHSCYIDCCAGGCGDEMDDIFKCDLPNPEDCKYGDDGTTDDRVIGCVADDPPNHRNSVCPEGSPSPVTIVRQDGPDLDDRTFILYNIELEQGTSEQQKIRFQVLNPFDKDATIYVKYDRRYEDSEFYDPKCDNIPNANPGCNIESQEFVVDCYEWDEANSFPFALVEVFYANNEGLNLFNNNVAVEGAAVDKCCLPKGNLRDSGYDNVVSYTYAIACHCPQGNAEERVD